jgi:hypothetical protein
MKSRILIYVLLVLIAGCTDNKEKSPVSTIKEEMKSHCFGRHLIDFPAGYELAVGTSAIFSPPGETENLSTMDLTILAAGITQAEFTARVQKRRAEVVAAADDTINILKEVKILGDNATLLRVLTINESYVSELHLLKGNSYIKIQTDSFNNKYLEAEKRLAEFANNIELAKAPADPQPGFCLGPVVINGRYEREYADFALRSRLRPDVLVAISVDTYAPDESTTLLQRGEGPDSLLTTFKVSNTVLRKGETKVAGMRAQEWLGWFPPSREDGGKEYKLVLETMRPTPSPLQPSIHIEINTGMPDLAGIYHKTTFTNQEAVSFWDAMAKTIRLRPGATD